MPLLRALSFRAPGFLLCLAAALPAAVGDWVSYSDYSVPSALAMWHGELFAGTNGGIRRLDVRAPYPYPETDYNNMQGLVDVRIVAFAVDADDRLWAGSRSGQIFRLEGKTWSAWGKSYASAGWTLNPRAMAAAGRYLILGSEQGVSLFDRKSGTAAVNLTKFGTIGKQSVTSVLPAGDTLYIVAGGTVLYARFDWNDANSGKYGVAVFDPANWKPAANLAALPDWALQKGPYDSAKAAESDSGSGPAADTGAPRIVELSRIGGALVAHDSGSLIDSPFRIKAIRGTQNYIDGKTFGNLSQGEAAAVSGRNAYLAGRQGIFWFRDTGWSANIEPPGPIPSSLEVGEYSRLTAVAARDGEATFLSGLGIFRLKRGELQERVHFDPVEIAIGELRNITALDDGHLAFGSWGHGFQRIAPDGAIRRWDWSNSCLKAVEPNWTVIQSMSDAVGDDIWMVVKENKGGEPAHLMAHFDLATNTLTCPDLKGDSYETSAIRILSDTLFAVAGDKSMRIYRYGLAGIKSSIEPFGLVTGGNGTDEGRDMQMDAYGRLWALMNGRIGYVDSLDTKIGRDKKFGVEYLDGFTGVNCAMLETDGRAGLWAGCENGIYHLSPHNSQPLLTRIEHYTVNDGLLADRVIDLSVDKRTGMVWATTERGVNGFQSQAQAVLTGLDGVRAYPNPFRAKHRLLVIDNVPKGATGAIFTQSGDAVRRFETRDMLGNQFQWDGKNGAGNPVTPGIYLYSVSAGRKSSHGKIIVAR